MSLSYLIQVFVLQLNVFFTNMLHQSDFTEQQKHELSISHSKMLEIMNGFITVKKHYSFIIINKDL